MSNILLMGEALLRIDIEQNFSHLNFANNKMFVGGSELNVACKLAENNNFNVSYLTTLPNNHIGRGVAKYVTSNSVNLDCKYVDEGRVGIYFHNKGIGIRNSIVDYDRKYSAFELYPLTSSDINLDDVDHFHVSGISAALSNKHQEVIIDTMKRCKEKGITISYDSNYRQKMWDAKSAGEFFEKTLSYVDYLFAGNLDFTYLLNMDEKLDVVEKIDILQSKYSNLKVVAFTNRNVINVSEHELTGYIYVDKKLYSTDNISFNVVDRIGGGDMYTASVLNEILENNTDYQAIVDKSMMNSVLLQTYDGDYIYNEVIVDNSKTGVAR